MLRGHGFFQTLKASTCFPICHWCSVQGEHSVHVFGLHCYTWVSDGEIECGQRNCSFGCLCKWNWVLACFSSSLVELFLLFIPQGKSLGGGVAPDWASFCWNHGVLSPPWKAQWNSQSLSWSRMGEALSLCTWRCSPGFYDGCIPLANAPVCWVLFKIWKTYRLFSPFLKSIFLLRWKI